MHIDVNNRCSDYNSYRAARVKSLFNAESGCNFDLAIDIPIDDSDWGIGVIVGPSGSGKTSLGRKIFGEDAFYSPSGWPEDAPIVDAIAPGGDFNAVTGALAAVGLGNVPTWLRPYPVLSNGEKFRADMARIISEAPAKIVVDEFTSVVDRQIARFGALAFQKAWRRTSGQCVLLSCHYDIVDWVEPDWVFDTATGEYAGRSLWRRPKFDLEIYETDGSYWPLFEPHHYLKLGRMVAAKYYVGFVDGSPVCHIATSPRFEIGYMRACRLVVMPEWQGAGVGIRFLNAVCEMQLNGENRWNRKCSTMLHTSHPGLCASLRRDKKWTQISAKLFGDNKKKCGSSIRRSHATAIAIANASNSATAIATANAAFAINGMGYGGHFRAVQGFRYLGEQPEKQCAAT